MSVGLCTDDLGMFVDSKEVVDDTLTIDTIVPKKGIFLGLDISKNSTGVTLIEDGERVSGNIVLDEVSGVHKEVLLRRELKKDLLQLVEGKDFDLIIIEDAYVGENAETVRTLFALNTAIDEMILDGVCTCKNFVRVNNQQWKSWLYTVDKDRVSKGLNDKEKIRICLEMLGVYEEGQGYQDRLDSTGLIVGYFLKGKSTVNSSGLCKKKVRISDVEAAYESDTSFLFYGKDDIDDSKIKYLDCNRISKKRMLELLTEEPESIFITSEPIMIGNLGVDLYLDVISEGGYFAFWIKRSRLKKFLN